MNLSHTHAHTHMYENHTHTPELGNDCLILKVLYNTLCQDVHIGTFVYYFLGNSGV